METRVVTCQGVFKVEVDQLGAFLAGYGVKESSRRASGVGWSFCVKCRLAYPAVCPVCLETHTRCFVCRHVLRTRSKQQRSQALVRAVEEVEGV